MKYDFDHIPERRHTDCIKWDLFPEDILPLWVADTDFAVCPKIIEAKNGWNIRYSAIPWKARN